MNNFSNFYTKGTKVKEEDSSKATNIKPKQPSNSGKPSSTPVRKSSSKESGNVEDLNSNNDSNSVIPPTKTDKQKIKTPYKEESENTSSDKRRAKETELIQRELQIDDVEDEGETALAKFMKSAGIHVKIEKCEDENQTLFDDKPHSKFKITVSKNSSGDDAGEDTKDNVNLVFNVWYKDNVENVTEEEVMKSICDDMKKMQNVSDIGGWKKSMGFTGNAEDEYSTKMFNGYQSLGKKLKNLLGDRMDDFMKLIK